MKRSWNRKNIAVALVFAALTAVLALLPTGFEKQIYYNSEGVRATVLSVDNSGVYNTGLVKQGAQQCVIRIETGSHAGEEVEATNLYTGKLEFDKVFETGDSAWVLLERGTNGSITFANMIDHYRISGEALLIAAFALCLVIFSGFTGLRTLLSFAFALLCIWKVLIPAMLKGYDPILVAMIVGNVITVATLLLVAGFSRKAWSAIAGAVACSLFTCLLAVVCGSAFRIHGAVMQWSESLLYAGFEGLDLTAIFQAGIYLACSGAVLDLAIDISSALDEVVLHQPAITRKELMRSGFVIGKSVVGSQTTTLLLAYMGGNISVMMVYMAQGTPLMNILNSKMFASELLHTFVGCIGIVLVSPLTSLICGFVYKPSRSVAAQEAAAVLMLPQEK
jgi:uncharacterized membrane protein